MSSGLGVAQCYATTRTQYRQAKRESCKIRKLITLMIHSQYRCDIIVNTRSSNSDYSCPVKLIFVAKINFESRMYLHSTLLCICIGTSESMGSYSLHSGLRIAGLVFPPGCLGSLVKTAPTHQHSPRCTSLAYHCYNLLLPRRSTHHGLRRFGQTNQRTSRHFHTRNHLLLGPLQ